MMRNRLPTLLLLPMLAGATKAVKAQAVYQNKITFVSKTSLAGSRGTDVFVLSGEGGNPVNLTKNPEQEFDPAWSPDWKKIAFAIMPVPEPGKPPASDIHIMNADGSGRKALTHHEKMLVFAPAWSPNGKRIIFSSWETLPGKGPVPHIYVMEADGKNGKRLGEGMVPVWSPDGTEILFTKVEVAPGHSFSFRLCIMKADGTGRKVLATDAALGAWSPDGKRIAYVSSKDDQFDLFVMNATGTEKTQLTKTPDQEFPAQWSNDSQRLYFNRMTIPPQAGSGGSVICIMDANGGNVKPITANKTFDFAGNGLSFLLYPVFVRSYYRANPSAKP